MQMCIFVKKSADGPCTDDGFVGGRASSMVPVRRLAWAGHRIRPGFHGCPQQDASGAQVGAVTFTSFLSIKAGDHAASGFRHRVKTLLAGNSNRPRFMYLSDSYLFYV